MFDWLISAAQAATDLKAAVESLDVYYLDWRGHLVAMLFGGLGGIFGLIRRRHHRLAKEKNWLDYVGDVGLSVMAAETTLLIYGYRELRYLAALITCAVVGHFWNRKLWAKVDRMAESDWRAWWKAWVSNFLHLEQPSEKRPPDEKK